MVQCPGLIAGERCTLEDGHYPATPHHVSVQVPRDIGRLMATLMSQAEEAKAGYEKARKRSNLMYRAWQILFAFYLILVISELVEIVIQ